MDRLQYSLTYEGITTILDVAPVSWDKSILKTERQIGVWGVTRAFQFQFEFVKDGADILRNAFYNNGIEADVTILIEKFNYISHEYEEIYSGKINFSKFIDDTISVKVDAIDGNLPQLLKANENTKYQIAYNDFYRHYQILKDIYNFSNAQVNYTGTVAVEYIFLKYPIKLTKSSEVENIGGQVTVKNSTLTAGVQTAVLGYIFDEDNTFLTAEKDCTVNLDVDIKYFIERYAITFDDFVDLRLRYDLELWKYDNDSSNWILLDRKRDEIFYDNITSVTRGNGYVNFLTQKKYKLKSGDKLAWQVNINWYATGDGTWTGGEYEDGYTLSTKCNITIGEQIYDVPCINLTDLLTSLGNKITGNLTGIESTYFTDKNIILFSGNAIRGFPNATLNISFNDVFKFLNGCYGAGFGVENNKIVIENRGYFFEDTEIEEFTNSNDFSIEHAEELIYNTAKSGNNSPAIEGKYGNYEPNNQFIFGLPITKIKKELNVVSPIRTDSLGIDALRVAQNFSNSDSKDNANDNEIFAVVCNLFPEIVEFIAPIFEVNVPPVEYWLGGDMNLIGTSPANADLKVTYGNGTIVYPFSLYPATGNIQVISFTKFGYTAVGYESVKIEWNNDTVQMNNIRNNIALMQVITIYSRVYEALKTDYTITSGLPTDISDDIFNKSLSPKRCLINNSDLLNTALYKQPQSNEVAFLSSLKNNAMVSGGLTENAALKRSEFNAAIFDPIYYNATVPVSADTWQKILNTPKGYFSVWYKDVKYLGYILEASLNSALRSEMKIKLLAKTPAVVPIYIIPSPLFWIDASDSQNYELIDNKVATVYDLSENETNVVQQIIDARPTIETISGKNYFKFDGIDDYLNGGNICDLNNPSHIFIIFKTNTQSKNQNIVSRSLFGPSPHRYTLGLISNYLYAFIEADNSSTRLTAQSSNLYTSFKCVEFVKNNSNYVKLNENNILIDTDAQEYTFISNLTDYDFLIGAYNNTLGKTPPQSGFYFDGYIGEIIIYNEQLNETQRTMIYNYLKNKWEI